ncbi:hypothetical protein K8R62_04005, partial [bacterium]|nr:hypothetical protein [bacterium]
MEAILRSFFYDVWIKKFVFSVTSIITIICFFGCLTIFISRAEADNISKKPKVEAFIINKNNTIDQNKSLSLMADKKLDSLVKSKHYNILSF